jgi:NitT/TauT family transport system ATP-binding protein
MTGNTSAMAAQDRSVGAEDSGTGAPLFVCDGLCIEFDTAAGPQRVLEDVCFSVAPGEFVSIVGGSGTGKTTLLRALGGLVRPKPGSTVTFDGRPVESPPSGAVVVFQDYRGSLLPWRTVEKNVELGVEGRMPAAERKRRVSEVLELVGLAHRRRDYPWTLSGGMQQRVQIARALAMQPRVLLMDEPFGALDAMTKAQLQDELQRVHRATGTTVVFVTHDIEEAVYLSDRVLVLSGSPARVTLEVDVPLPRPREQVGTRESREYLEIRHLVHGAISHSA